MLEIVVIRIIHASKTKLIPIAWSFIASLIAIIPPLLKPGFPPNHEDDTFVLRTMVYAKHFQFGDLVPVWSASDNFGMGSPLPGLYHRLFYMVSGIVYAVVGNAKASIAITLIVFTSLGVNSVFLLLRSFNSSIFVSLLGASVFPFLNYSVTNWLVRGAMAEYSAMMLLPLLLYMVKRSIDRSLLYASTGLVFGLLFLAHSVVAYFAALLIGAAMVSSCLLRQSSWTLFSPRKIGLAFLGFLATTWWSLLPLWYMRQRFDMTRLLPDFLAVRFQFRRITEYLWDSSWSWSNPPQLFTVQLDIVLVISVGLLVLLRKYNRNHLWIIGLFIITMIFQYGGSWRLYDFIPGAKYIQFPWRLLALSSTLLVILAFVGFQKSRSAVTAIALSTILISGTWQRVDYYDFPDRLEQRNSRNLSHYSLSLFGEYLPANAPLLIPNPKSSAVFSEWKSEIEEFIDAHNAAEQCVVTRVSPIDELRTVDFKTDCTKSSLALLPIFSTSAHTISSSFSRFQENCDIRNELQSLCAISVPAGITQVRIHMPTFLSIIEDLLG